MQEQSYEKTLTANDTGKTGGHQAGIHVPKSQTDLLNFLPSLDSRQKNPDTWLSVTDDEGTVWKFRYIHYNNRLHDASGTRNEYRITHMTKYFRAAGAEVGDKMVLSGKVGSNRYRISIQKFTAIPPDPGTAVRIRLRGWTRVH
ncbi:EcoRII N-terminal effector-binding domain-containing protein [Mesorhizobium sp. M0767]|uniref:EcoRII N-terminal effector-binding domain-containing protein n=1 Tax=Mesorhizobium sp. M0767 TaxID=2956995 RepID=UPI0033381DC7